MSHAKNNAERSWDKGLRDGDLVSFLLCVPRNGSFVASDQVNLFRVGDMRATVDRAGLSQMKAASEGSEIQLTWPATIPGRKGVIKKIDSDGIHTELENGRKQKYRITRKDDNGDQYRFGVYAEAGDSFGAGDTIIASAIDAKHPIACPKVKQYDFLRDLTSKERETVYAAVKALGYLPELRDESAPKLVEISEDHEDRFIRLEASASLARLGEQQGYATVRAYGADSSHPNDLRMEAALILGELATDDSAKLLKEILETKSNDSELRAAAAWGLSQSAQSFEDSELMTYLSDDAEAVAVHCIAGATRLISEKELPRLLDELDVNARRSAGITRAIMSSQFDPVPVVVKELSTAKGAKRRWMIYLLARFGRERCEQHLNDESVLAELEFFWSIHEENWTNRLDVADQIDFLMKQILD